MSRPFQSPRQLLSRSLLLAGLCCAGCSEEDTILSLNVSLEDTARAATSLEVTISQPGHTPVAASVSVPTMPADGGAVSKKSFYERIKLPSEFSEGQAQVSVVAKQGASNLATAQAVIEVEPQGAVAGYVTLGAKVPPPAQDAGTDAG